MTLPGTPAGVGVGGWQGLGGCGRVGGGGRTKAFKAAVTQYSAVFSLGVSLQSVHFISTELFVCLFFVVVVCVCFWGVGGGGGLGAGGGAFCCFYLDVCFGIRFAVVVCCLFCFCLFVRSLLFVCFVLLLLLFWAVGCCFNLENMAQKKQVTY